VKKDAKLDAHFASIGFTDDDLAQSIMSTAKDNNYALLEFIHILVQAEEFQFK